MKAVATVLLGALVALSALHARADEPQLAPYVADYDVKYGSMSVGSSRMELRRTGVPGQWQLQSRTTASGLARLFTSGTLVQHSTFQLEQGGMRPLSYRFDDGMKRSAKDVALDFDWDAGRVKGVAEGEPVDIASLVQASIFAPFEQGDAGIARRFGGTGLGLAITRQIIEQHHGEIHIDSAVGRGTRVTVTLPTEREEL